MMLNFKKRVLVFIVSVLSLSFSDSVFAATFTVAPDSEYQTIQSAIIAASNGDTVLVAPGVYRENVAFGGRIILKAENAAPGATVIEAVDPAVSAITAAGPAEINGFTIRGATNSAGIRLNYGAWEAKISNNIIESNLDGIYIVNYGSGNSEITRNIFRDNTGYDINLPAEYNSSAGVSTQSAGNIIYLNDFYGTLYPYQDYVNYWNSQEELGYKYQNKIYRGKPGNYQSQCQTEDPDGDGIGNDACPIGGYTDSFPLAQPFANYEIVESEIISDQQEWGQDKIIDNPVVINADARLTIKKGVKITFQSNGSILVNGDLLAKGTVKNPIVFSGMNGYAGKIITVGESGKADFRNAEISTSAIDGGLPPRQTAVSVSGAGILEMQACNINGNAAGIELNRVNGGNIKINRSKFFNNIKDIANNDPADAILPDFKWNWWGDSDGPNQSRIAGAVDSAGWVAEESFRDPVVVVPGIALSEKEFFGMGEWKIDPILHTYDNLIETLQANGYVKDKDLFVFPYDWRNSNVVSAQLLRAKISEIMAKNNGWPKIDIISHSMGGLLAREYIESDYYQGDVDQLVTLATPQNGAPEAYLRWENGDSIDRSIQEILASRHLWNLAKEGGYNFIFNYIHQRPIVSVEELLPIYSYLYDADNNDALRIYPQNYPVNLFLQKLNSADNLEKLKDVEFDKIIAVDEGKADTITGYRIKNYTADEHWVNGKPVNWGVPFLQDQSIYRGSGDNTVPLESAQSGNIFSDEYVQVDSNHLDLVTKAQSDIFEILNGYRSGQEITRWRIPDLLDVMVHSPVDIQVVAPDGKRVGKDFANGQILNEIEGAFYSGYEAQAEFITIPNPLIGEYKILIQGTGNGNYEIETVRYRQESENSEVQDIDVRVQGTTALGQKHEIILNTQPNGEIAVNDDIIPPIVKINSPLADNSYLNNVVLPIDYSVSDNKSDLDKIAIQTYFDGVTTTENIIDLAFRNTGSHYLAIRAQDETGNITTTTAAFSVFATIDSVVANAGKFSDTGLIKRPQTIVLKAQLKALKYQFDVLDKLKNNNRLTTKAKTAAIKALKLVINKQIDLLVKEIQKSAGKGIKIDIVNLLVDSLKYIKIK